LTPPILVLLVEDDPLVQDMLEATLEEGGFTIKVAAAAEQAIEMLDAEGADYRALITDVNLPGRLSGWDVAKRGREINGELPVVYITGAAAGDWPSNGVPKSILLVKPFAPAQAVTAVAQLLNASSGSES
jgi:DNA-binding response OmpR family regulator